VGSDESRKVNFLEFSFIHTRRKSKILLNLIESLASRTERQYRICERHPAGFADNDREKTEQYNFAKKRTKRGRYYLCTDIEGEGEEEL